MEQEKHENAIPLLEELLARSPDEPELYQELGYCYEETGELEKGIEITRRAVERFPDDIDVLVDHAEILFFNNRFEEAEQVYRRILTIIDPNEKQARSSFLVCLGETLWEQDKQVEALEAWKEALKENPENEEIGSVIALRTSESGGTAEVKPIDDFSHFYSIAKSKYLKGKGRDSYGSPEEQERVSSLIKKSWEEFSSEKTTQLKKMTAEEKEALFQSVHIDFSQPAQVPQRNVGKQKKGKKSSLQPTVEERRFLQQLDARFGFLPPMGGAKLVLFGFPALLAAGMTPERLREIINGDLPAVDEEDAMEWAYEILEAVLEATYEKGSREEIEAMMDAMAIARERVEEEDAVYIVQTIRQAIELVDAKR
jgi:tetratricopeptide (TPR) repeat protein